MVFTNYDLDDDLQRQIFIMDLIAEQPEDSNRQRLLEELGTIITDAMEQSYQFEELIEKLKKEQK